MKNNNCKIILILLTLIFVSISCNEKDNIIPEDKEPILGTTSSLFTEHLIDGNLQS